MISNLHFGTTVGICVQMIVYFCNKLIKLVSSMQEGFLPAVKDLYRFQQQNKDYSVIRKYCSTNRQSNIKKSITKKGSYLEDAIKASSSPGPASKCNTIPNWEQKSTTKPAYSKRMTYIDEAQHLEKKKNCPSPNQYKIEIPWPKIDTKSRNHSDRLTYLDNAEYEALHTPGPGNYIVTKPLGANVKEEAKHVKTVPLKPRQNKEPDMTTYDPCSLEFSTFQRYDLFESKKINSKPKREIEKKPKGKENKKIIGPGEYDILNYWQGKKKRSSQMTNLF